MAFGRMAEQLLAQQLVAQRKRDLPEIQKRIQRQRKADEAARGQTQDTSTEEGSKR